jgi:hypothetical protein
MNFTVGVAGRGAVTIGSKGFGSFIFYFTLTLSDKRGIIETHQGSKYRVSDKGDRERAQTLKGDKHQPRKNA